MLDKSFPASLHKIFAQQFFRAIREKDLSNIAGRRKLFKAIGTTIKLLLPTKHIILIYCKIKEYSYVGFSSH